MAQGGYQPSGFDNNRRKYNRVCRHFLQGVCNRGEACQYLHVRQDETQYVSQDTFNGGCACRGGCSYVLGGVYNNGEAPQYLPVTSIQDDTQCVSQDTFNGGCAYGGGCSYFLGGVYSNGEAPQYLHVTSRQDETRYVSQDSFYGGCVCGGGCRSIQVSLQTDSQSSLRTPISLNQQPVYNEPYNFIIPTDMVEELGPERRHFTSKVLLPLLTPDMFVYEPVIERFHRVLCPLNSFGTCPSKENCINLHGDICNVCKMPRLHPTDNNQRESHYQECLAIHQRQSLDKECGICLENVMEKEGLDPEKRFGILENCNHSFCMSCIEQWRSTLDETFARHRTCPICRSHSDLLLPCQYWIECTDEKKQRTNDYRMSLLQFFAYLESTYVMFRE